MAVGKAKVAPFINKEFQVTGEFGTWRETRYHVGIDLATSTPERMYSLGDGYIFRNWWNDARGWAVIVKMDSGIAFEYQHMQAQCLLQEGARVEKGQFLGIEGLTGQITGLHLHMEMQDLSSGRDWDYTATLSSYMNPAPYMGIENKTGTNWIYDGTIEPEPEPEPSTSKHKKFKWVLYANKLRKNY